MTINATNTNYNPNLMQEVKNNNAQNTINNTPNTLGLAKDKSQAVQEVLGYGVDSEGFFTSDLNEAAGIPKDYRIEAERIKKMVEWNTRDDVGAVWSVSTHTEIDIAKSIANVYNEFADFLNNETDTNYYSNEFDNNTNYIINETLQDKNLSKGEKIRQFLTSVTIGKRFIEGNLTLLGKLTGYDKNISQGELKQFYSFMESNKIGSILTINKYELPWDSRLDKSSLEGDSKGIGLFTKNSEIINMAHELYMEYKALVERNDLSLEEFKKEYLKFKEKHDEFIEKYNNIPEEDKIYPEHFRTIQVTKKSETYQDLDSVNMLEFIQSQQKLEQILLLFNQESNNEALNLKRFERFFKTDLGKLDIEI